MAVLFNALAPVVSHAMSAPSAQTEICTAMGVTMVTMPGQPDAQKLVKSMTHCGYCATHAGSFALPSAPGLTLAMLDLHDSHPYLFFHAPQPLPVWTAPPSRAPPASA